MNAPIFDVDDSEEGAAAAAAAMGMTILDDDAADFDADDNDDDLDSAIDMQPSSQNGKSPHNDTRVATTEMNSREDDYDMNEEFDAAIASSDDGDNVDRPLLSDSDNET